MICVKVDHVGGVHLLSNLDNYYNLHELGQLEAPRTWVMAIVKIMTNDKHELGKWVKYYIIWL